MILNPHPTTELFYLFVCFPPFLLHYIQIYTISNFKRKKLKNFLLATKLYTLWLVYVLWLVMFSSECFHVILFESKLHCDWLHSSFYNELYSEERLCMVYITGIDISNNHWGLSTFASLRQIDKPHTYCDNTLSTREFLHLIKGLKVN